MNRRKFIGSCMCCAFASSGAVLLYKNHIANHNNDRKDFIMNRVEVHLAEHCNLNCKYCGNFSSIAEKEFYNLDKFKQDMKKISSIFNKKLNELPLTGGEPLLNPQINEYVKISRKYFPNTNIIITTNATLLDSMDNSFWETLNENKVEIMPSIYPIKINWKPILDKAKKYNVKICAHQFRQVAEDITLDNIDQFRITSFNKRILNENGINIDNTNCIVRFQCNSLYDGKLYPCPTIAYIRHLNKKYNTNFVVSEMDYIDIYKVKNISEIKKYMQTTMLPFCSHYCGEIKRGLKWENSIEHSLSEWT